MDLSTLLGVVMALLPKINEALADGEVTLGEVLEVATATVESLGMESTVIYTKPKLAKGKK